MFKPILDLSQHSEPAVFDHLYTFFQTDFIQHKAYLADEIYVDPSVHGSRNGKEKIFWHITTRERTKRVKEGKHLVKTKTRAFDPERSCRIHWIKPMLTTPVHPEIKVFYRKETKGKKPIRLYLWAENHDFVVILQKLGRSSTYLVTSFYVTEKYKRQDYQKWYQNYLDQIQPELCGCEWF